MNNSLLSNIVKNTLSYENLNPINKFSTKFFGDDGFNEFDSASIIRKNTVAENPIKNPITNPIKNPVVDSKLKLGMGMVADQKALLDKSFKFSAGSGIFDMAMTGVQLAQGITANAGDVTRNITPDLKAPKLIDTTTSAQAMIKENLATSTNTSLAYAKEHGMAPGRVATSIFANANKIMRESTVSLNDRRQQIYSQHEQAVTSVENQNAINQAADINDYRRRKEEALKEDNMRRDMQVNAAVSNFGKIGTKVAGDYLLTNILKSKVDENFFKNLM